MKIVIPKEWLLGESRCALLPSFVQRLKKLGMDVEVEKGLGNSLFISDEEYERAGALSRSDRMSLISSADLILQVRKPLETEVKNFKQGCTHLSFLDPFRETVLIEKLAEQGVSAVSLEMVPRTTLAQKMDALSSQANVAGYAAVIVAAEKSHKILPMMTTAAGTVFPANVFVVGAGVAGLQAIATAKRLGAKVIAFDTRAAAEEQVKSLGAKFLKIDLGETSHTKEGYAKALSEEQLSKQKAAMGETCAGSDIVITTAQVLGKSAPRIITKGMIEKMKPGSVIVDMAVDTGGNVEGSLPDQAVLIGGVTLLGLGNLPSKVAFSASYLYISNLINLLEDSWNKETKTLNFEAPILRECLLTHQGKNLIKEKFQKKGF